MYYTGASRTKAGIIGERDESLVWSETEMRREQYMMIC